MALIRPPPLAPGELRPLVDHTSRHFAIAMCPTCGRRLYVSERDFRLLSGGGDALLGCDRCGRRWQPMERIPSDYRHAPDLIIPSEGWR